MKLLLKFNWCSCCVRCGFPDFWICLQPALQQNAKAEIMENARIMMEAAIAVRRTPPRRSSRF